MNRAWPASSQPPSEARGALPTWRVRLGATCLTWLLRGLSATLRVRWEGDEHQLEATREGPAIYVAWHGNQLPLFVPLRGANRTLLISLSRDGELLRLVCERLGFRTVRGSSSRGGTQAFEALLEETRGNHSVLLAIDGPRGPDRRPKPGAVRLAALTGRPLLPISIEGQGIRLRTWDRFFIPFPFSRLIIRRGRPIYVAPDAKDGAALEMDCTQVESALNSLEEPIGPETALRKGPLMSGDDAAPAASGVLGVYVALMALLGPLITLTLLICALFRPSWRVHIGERMGLYPSRLPDRPIWIHAASLGEVGVARGLLNLLGTELAGRSILTTTTASGRASALAAGFSNAFLAPLDLPIPLISAFKRIRPGALILIETELWPGLLWMARMKKVPVIVVNGRLTERSLIRYHRWRLLFAPLLARLRVAARSTADAARFRALGVQTGSCPVLGEAKLVGSSPLPASPNEPLTRWLKGGPTLVAASLHPGEASTLLEAVKTLWPDWPQLRLLLAPRHPARWLEQEVGFRTHLRWSLVPKGSELPENLRILVLDTLGELSSILPHAHIVFVGGTLVTLGGHNLLEVAQAGKMALYGPSLTQVREQADLLERAGAGREVANAHQLMKAIGWSLINPEEAGRCGEAGRQAVADQRRIGEALACQVREWLIASGAA